MTALRDPADIGDPGELRRIALAAIGTLEDGDDDQAAQRALQALLRERELRRATAARRAGRHGGVEDALGRLHRLPTSADLLDAICHEVVAGCGFARAMLSRVQADVWRPWMVHFTPDRHGGESFLRWIADREVQLEQLPLERSVVQARAPEIVHDAPSDPRTYRPFVEAGRLRSYVVAPIIPAGRVVGLLHADHGPGGHVSDQDRVVLSIFAEAVGRLYERMVILERMGAQRSYMHETFEMAESMMGTLSGAEIELEPGREDDARVIQEFIEEPVATSDAIDAMLTRREKEVLAMIVRGHSNAEIGERLVIQVGTVKSHVKRILRKVGAVNRAEAISRYMGA